MKKPAPKQRGLGSIYRRTVTQADGTDREIPTWHIQFSVRGQQYRESTHTDNYNEAQRFLKRRIADITTGKFAGTSADRVLMKDLLADVLADYELHERHSLDSMAKPLVTNYLMPHFGRMRATNVKIPVITTYMRERKAAGTAVASVNRELGLLRRAFNLGVANGKFGAVQVPSFKGLLQKEKNARQGFWEHHEYKAFRDALPVDERAMFVFGYWTGCRFGEIAVLEWSQVDLPGRAVRLRADQTKPGEARIIPLGGPGTDLYDMLLAQRARHQELCPGSPWVFFRQGRAPEAARPSVRRGKRVGDITKAWAHAAAATGINRLFHDLRRTGVRNLIKAGVPEKVAMLISGHKTRSVFDRYHIVDERDLHDAAARLYQHVTGKGPGANSTNLAQTPPASL
jgi:integrase